MDVKDISYLKSTDEIEETISYLKRLENTLYAQIDEVRYFSKKVGKDSHVCQRCGSKENADINENKSILAVGELVELEKILEKVVKNTDRSSVLELFKAYKALNISPLDTGDDEDKIDEMISFLCEEEDKLYTQLMKVKDFFLGIKKVAWEENQAALEYLQEQEWLYEMGS